MDNSGPANTSFILKVGLLVTLKFKTLDRNLASYLSFCPLLMSPLSIHGLVAVTFGLSGISGSMWRITPLRVRDKIYECA